MYDALIDALKFARDHASELDNFTPEKAEPAHIPLTARAGSDNEGA